MGYIARITYEYSKETKVSVGISLSEYRTTVNGCVPKELQELMPFFFSTRFL